MLSPDSARRRKKPLSMCCAIAGLASIRFLVLGVKKPTTNGYTKQLRSKTINLIGQVRGASKD